MNADPRTSDMAREILYISGVNPKKCMKCGKCSATCPSGNEMDIRPHRFVALVEAGDMDTLLRSEALYHCLSCMACVERCPRGVEPARLVEAVRLLAIRKQGANHMIADDIPALADDRVPQQLLVSAMRKYGK